MNRTGLAIALAVAIVVGIVFGIRARYDLDLAALFFDAQTHMFRANSQAWVQDSRAAARWLITLIAAPAFLAILAKLALPRRPMLIGARAALLIVLTLGLGPGLLTNIILKDHWGRSRPIDVTAFGGADRFVAWWDPRGECPNNCSFVAGEPSGAFWTLVPAALTPPQWRLPVYAAALAFGAAVGLLRMAAGAHFFTDVVFAGVFMYLLGWVLHGAMFRWRGVRTDDETVERALGQSGEAIRAMFAALSQRLRGRAGKDT